ncbi:MULTISPECIES: RND transporter [unclassified Oceanispirochaeta]|uniref:RND transporter n=1 Tax=unclassified Oceanispirochaeta TaxID=2635722 RepID=UPI000E099FA7|nr:MULTISPECIES: RND transporter [unclassified Oceanispirochaeta]MBF9014239.1 RND transporter [Oceanispirochaeta sp. M2]NPD71125.1 RND transporter [Oceanispirochaeta sp. M1]RDG33519.1 RND transporter [Oceanispirochaeta sp. M1]
MFSFLDKIEYPLLIIAAVLMLLAPFTPMPHIIEKLIMLREGTLKKPIDIFDLFYHLVPTILLIIKIIRDYGAARG